MSWSELGADNRPHISKRSLNKRVKSQKTGLVHEVGEPPEPTFFANCDECLDAIEVDEGVTEVVCKPCRRARRR